MLTIALALIGWVIATRRPAPGYRRGPLVALGAAVAGLTPGWVLLSGWLLPNSLTTTAAIAAFPLHPSPVVVVLFAGSVFITLLLESARAERRTHQNTGAGPKPTS